MYLLTTTVYCSLFLTLSRCIVCIIAQHCSLVVAISKHTCITFAWLTSISGSIGTECTWSHLRAIGTRSTEY